MSLNGEYDYMIHYKSPTQQAKIHVFTKIYDLFFMMIDGSICYFNSVLLNTYIYVSYRYG